MRSAALTLALLIILSGAAPATALVPTGVDDGQEPASATALATAPAVAQVESDTRPATEIRVQLERDTDARWTVTHRYALAGEDEVEAFRALGAEFENGQASVGFDASVFRTIAAEAAQSTGRNMVIRDVAREASVERNTTATATGTGTVTPTATPTGTPENETVTGVLRLSFTWTNFLERRDDGTLQLGDVFVTSDGGTWLSSLGDDQRLTVVTPPGYVISRTSFPIQQQNGSLIIDGPREFTSEERLSVTYRESGQSELPWVLIVGGGVAVVVVLALVFLRSRDRRSAASATGNGTPMTNGGETTAESPERTPDDAGATAGSTSDASTTSPSRGPEPGPGPGPGVDAGAEDAEAPAEDEEPDFDLLSDEERVEYLLEQRGGRMKQANIVKETGWSDAKVSQLLSSMAEAGRVEKLRLGRENLISIPDADEDAADE
jgi:hypothetical protein